MTEKRGKLKKPDKPGIPDKLNKPGSRKHTKQDLAFTVAEPAELLAFLLEKMKKEGRNHVKSLLSRKQISVNGKITLLYNYLLAKGDQVTVNLAMVGEPAVLQGLKIIHEDADIIVIEKQAGLLSIASLIEKEFTAYRQLTDYVRQSNVNNRIFIVHRLDRETSGVMMFAKNEQTQQKLQNSWQEMIIDRAYAVVVEGIVRKPEASVKSWLKESKTLKMYSSPDPDDGQEAVTHYKVVQTAKKYTLLEVRLETGRKNQIRVHMQDIGHPVVGDEKYGSTLDPMGRMGLHARILAFYHPATGKEMRFDTEVPEKFLRLFR